MKTIAKTLFLLSLIMVVAACQEPEPAYKSKLDVKPEPYELDFDRYEEVLFNLDTTNFQAELMKIQGRYRVFLSGDLNNLEAVQYLKDFATDPFSIALYQKVKAAFLDLKEVEPLVEEVFAHFHRYYPDIALPKKVFTCITGVHPDEPPIQIIDNQLVISLDWYLNDEETYDQIGMPRYMSLRRNVPTLAKELAEQLYMFYIYEWRKQGQIVGEMVFYGRRNFFIEAMCPELPDSILLGYSSDQWHWAVENEGQMWADIVGNKRLYDAGLDAYMMYFGDGPFTQAYSNEAPSRLGEFFGLNIVRSYFSSHETTLQDLMNRKDLQNIFQDSGYKPKK
jgi:hypothetical protein